MERLVAERTEKAEQVSDAATAAAARPVTPAAGDRLELSSAAQGASQSQEAAFNREKVEAIKQQIARGEYPLDADKMAQSAPLRRLGDDEDLKGLVTLYASDAGKHITGQWLAVDGGVSAIIGG